MLLARRGALGEAVSAERLMEIRLRRIRIALVIGLALLWTNALSAEDQGWLVPAQLQQEHAEEPSGDPRVMTENEWEALAQKVGMNLNWIGIQMGVSPQELAFYVPALTQEYLQAFQLSLTQGATKQQADILASQYIFARIRQLAAQSGSSLGSQGEEGCVYSRGGSFCAGTDGFRSFSFQ